MFAMVAPIDFELDKMCHLPGFLRMWMCDK